MKKRFYIAAAVVALFTATVWFMNPFLFLFSAIPLLIWFGPPVTIYAVVCLLIAVQKGRPRREPLTILSVVFGVACFVVLYWDIQERAVDGAKAYPALVAPMLEAYKQAHGTYPTNLDQLASKPSLPRLLRRNSYYSDGQKYYFNFRGRFITTWYYDSGNRFWTPD